MTDGLRAKRVDVTVMVHAMNLRVVATSLAGLIATLAVTCQPALAGSACGRAEMALRSRTAHVDSRMIAQSELHDSYARTDLLHYDIEIELFPDGEEIAGTTALSVRSLADDLTEFAFRLSGEMEITSAFVGNDVPVDVTEASSTVRVAKLDRTYATGEEFTVTIRYRGPGISTGLGGVNFARHRGADVVYSLAAPWNSHLWFPCTDGDVGMAGDNLDKALVDVAIIAPAELRSVSNGLLQGVDDLPENRRRYRWHSGYPISPYLISFATTNYTTWTVPFEYDGGSMPVEFNIYPEEDDERARSRLERTVAMLATFGELFGPYPFLEEKYGIYQFEFGGGMEHQTNSGQGGLTQDWLTAHELSHQWWGDAVTCRTWEDVWLNEGFATYAEALWKEFKPGGSVDARALHRWMASRRPARTDDSVYVYNTSSISRIYDTDYSYRKGAWVLHQLRHVIGDEAFFDALRQFRTLFEGDVATTEDFATVAEGVSDRDLGWFFDQWVYGFGTPEYCLEWSCDQVNGQNLLSLQISQIQDPAFGVFTMPIDVRVDFGGESADVAEDGDDHYKTYTVWNTKADEHFEIPIPAAAVDVTLDPLDWILHEPIERRAYSE